MTDRRHRRPLPLGGEDGLPFSKGLLARALTATGISTDRAYELALAADADITRNGAESISFERLEKLARQTLGDEDGATTMRRLRRFQDLYDLDLPVILLVGGATGTGKSTVATDVAYRLGITRVTSTDFVRQTMRAFFSQEFMPAIHHSSFEAGRATADDDATAAKPCSTAFSSRRATCWSACRPRSSVRSRRAGRWCSRASTSCRGCCRARSTARSSSSACWRSTTPRRTRATSGSATPTRRACAPTTGTLTPSTTSASSRHTSWAARESTRCR